MLNNLHFSHFAPKFNLFFANFEEGAQKGYTQVTSASNPFKRHTNDVTMLKALIVNACTVAKRPFELSWRDRHW